MRPYPVTKPSPGTTAASMPKSRQRCVTSLSISSKQFSSSSSSMRSRALSLPSLCWHLHPPNRQVPIPIRPPQPCRPWPRRQNPSYRIPVDQPLEIRRFKVIEPTFRPHLALPFRRQLREHRDRPAVFHGVRQHTPLRHCQEPVCIFAGPHHVVRIGGKHRVFWRVITDPQECRDPGVAIVRPRPLHVLACRERTLLHQHHDQRQWNKQRHPAPCAFLDPVLSNQPAQQHEEDDIQ